ncbi:MAG: methyltransferase domain-containing protein [Planctomycetota bacterium]|nr:methyltransferase domain-containing protein [Planctomycetota bacterium]MDP6941160.1 methyltransferase domain-containing protein [Planctomycetota bacterium]
MKCSLWVSVFLFASLLFACSGQNHDHNGQSGGLNDKFLSQDLDVSQWVERFEKEGREIFDYRHEIVEALDISKGMIVADIGAGTGLFEPLFAKAVGDNGKVIAVDIAQGFLDRIRGMGLENVETVLCDERSTGLSDGSVDLMFVCDTYHHFSYPEDTLKSMKAALRPGGRLVVVEFHRIEGESSDWIMKHVRADEATFTREIEAAGFEVAGRHELLEENYIIEFSIRH